MKGEKRRRKEDPTGEEKGGTRIRERGWWKGDNGEEERE